MATVIERAVNGQRGVGSGYDAVLVEHEGERYVALYDVASRMWGCWVIVGPELTAAQAANEVGECWGRALYG